MYRKLVLCLCAVLFWAVVASAQNVDKDKDKEFEVKELSGMSIVGNDEAIVQIRTHQHRVLIVLPFAGKPSFDLLVDGETDPEIADRAGGLFS